MSVDKNKDFEIGSGYGSDQVVESFNTKTAAPGVGEPTVHKVRVPVVSNASLKNKVFKKLGYKGINEEEAVPDEIFEYLWKISAAEQSSFVKNATNYVKNQIMDRPKRRLDKMIDLRVELLTMCDGFYDRVKKVLDRAVREQYDPTTDGGILEIDIQRYLDCFHLDIASFDELLIEEIKNRKADLESARLRVDAMNTKMSNFLAQNQMGLKNFLEESKFNIDVLSVADNIRQNVHKKEFRDRNLQL